MRTYHTCGAGMRHGASWKRWNVVGLALLLKAVSTNATNCQNFTGVSFATALRERLNETLPNVSQNSSFRYFTELLDFGLVECETLQYLGTLAGAQSQTGLTLLVIPDDAFEASSINYNRGLSNITSMDGTTACKILETSFVKGFINMRALRDGDVLETYSSNVLTAANSQLRVKISQNTNVRQIRFYNELGRFANVLVGNLQLCDLLNVNIIDAFLVSQASAFSSVYSIASRIPELSITFQAYQATEALRVQVESSEDDGDFDPQGVSSIKSCTPARPLKVYFLGSDRAWRRFFKRTQLTKSAVFTDVTLLLSILLYTEASALNGDNANSPGLEKYLTTSFSYGQQLKPVGVNSILSAIPGQIEAPGIMIDMADVATFAQRSVRILGLATSSHESNNARIVAPDIYACTGIVHVIDDILIPPTLTAFRQISLRSELSMFANMLRAPINAALLLELDTPSESNVFVDGIAFAPTNVAIKLALVYLGWEFQELLLQDALLKQIVEYHVIGSRAVVDDRLTFRMGLIREQQEFSTKLMYPGLLKETSTFTGASAAKQIRIIEDYASLVPRAMGFLLPSKIRLTIQGRLNSAELIRRDIPTTNGVLGILDAMLIPPTAELGLSLYDRIERTPELRIYEELVSVLGLRPELQRHGYDIGDSTIFAPNNAAWFKLLGELATTQEDVVNSQTALMYDLIMLMIIPRKEELSSINEEYYDPWLSKDISDDTELITALSSYSEVRYPSK